MNPKIVGFEELSDRCEKLRDAGKKLVATNGCFDLLHVGHVRYLQAARALGDFLAIGLNAENVTEKRPPNCFMNFIEQLIGATEFSIFM